MAEVPIRRGGSAARERTSSVGILLAVRATSAWWLVPPWALALVAVVLGASAAETGGEQALPVAAAFLLGCAARVLAPRRRSAVVVLLSACLCGVLAVVQSLAAVPADQLWWLASVLPALVVVGAEDAGPGRFAPVGLAVVATALGSFAGGGLDLVGSVLGVAALALVPTHGLVVLRRRGVLVPDDRVRLVAWAQASVAAGGVALAVLQVAPRVGDGGPEGVQAWASAAFALVLVAAYTPLVSLHARVGARGGPDPAATMIAVARELGAAPAGGPDALDRICDALRAAWDVAEVAIVRDGALPEPGRGDRTSVVTVALRSDDRSVGRLVVRARPGHDIEPVLPHIERIRSLLAASLALHDLNRGTEQLRRRLTGARDAERRVLARELGTRVVPAVRDVAAGLREAARSLVRDPSTAPNLDHVAQQLSRSTADVRRIARALLPGALDDGDLGGALEELLDQPGTSSRWSLDAGGADTLDPATQQALYLVLSDLLDAIRAEQLDAGLDVVLVTDDDVARLRVSMSDRELSASTRRRLREAIGRHASYLALTVRGLPGTEGVEVVVHR